MKTNLPQNASQGLAGARLVSPPAMIPTTADYRNYMTTKRSLQNTCSLALLFIAGFSTTTYRAAGVGYTLNINESNPSAVVITANGYSSMNADATTTANYGVDLVNFFTASTSFGAQTASGTPTLVPFVAGSIYDHYKSDTYLATGGSALDLNLYSSGTGAQTFAIGSAAFSTGTTVTIDLSAYLASLPAAGAHGNVYAGDSGGPGNGQIITTWYISAAPVPEPSTLALGLSGLGVLGLLFFHRRNNFG